eukprot:CCRYP_013379-RA/>CCRYP_013379-RA protein AED:0.06 eAED:0.03 QI:0/-1/0/1/-1/0/1/0/165
MLFSCSYRDVDISSCWHFADLLLRFALCAFVIFRATILLQNPESDVPNIRESLRQIYKSHGISGLWHGTSAGILKTVPKYFTTIFVKDYFEGVLQQFDPNRKHKHRDTLIHSTFVSSATCVAGATLMNPLNVFCNEMFKTNLGPVDAARYLHNELGWKFSILSSN